MLVTTPQASFYKSSVWFKLQFERGSLKINSKFAKVSLQDPFSPRFLPPLPAHFMQRPSRDTKQILFPKLTKLLLLWTCPICKHLDWLFPLHLECHSASSAEGKDCCGGDIGRNNKPTGKKESLSSSTRDIQLLHLMVPWDPKQKWRKNGSKFSKEVPQRKVSKHGFDIYFSDNVGYDGYLSFSWSLARKQKIRKYFSTCLRRPVFPWCQSETMIVQAGKLQTNIPHKYRYKNCQQNISKSSPSTYFF